MDAIRNFLGKIGVISSTSAVVSNKGANAASKKGKPHSNAQALEAKRKASRECMRKKRAKEKAEGVPKDVLERRRKYNRERMRRIRA